MQRAIVFRWLCTLCWTGTARPSALLDYANGWLVGHKVLLLGVTVLERFIAESRSRMELRLWCLRKRCLGIKLFGTHVLPTRIAALAHFAGTVKGSTVDRLPEVRRIATLVAFGHCLQASAQGNALDVLDLLLRELFTKIEKEDHKIRPRTIKNLDRAASTLAKACRMLLDPGLPDSKLRERVYAAIGCDERAQALSSRMLG